MSKRRLAIVVGDHVERFRSAPNYNDWTDYPIQDALEKAEPLVVVFDRDDGCDDQVCEYAGDTYGDDEVQLIWIRGQGMGVRDRNQRMLSMAAAVGQALNLSIGVIAFPGPGADDMIKQAREAGVPVWEPEK